VGHPTLLTMKLHPRYFIVNKASLEIRSKVMEIMSEHQLTSAEVIRIMLEAAADWMKYVVRAERHPDNMEKGADEA
jgi:hypothetical protein